MHQNKSCVHENKSCRPAPANAGMRHIESKMCWMLCQPHLLSGCFRLRRLLAEPGSGMQR